MLIRHFVSDVPAEYPDKHEGELFTSLMTVAPIRFLQFGILCPLLNRTGTPDSILMDQSFSDALFPMFEQNIPCFQNIHYNFPTHSTGKCTANTECVIFHAIVSPTAPMEKW